MKEESNHLIEYYTVMKKAGKMIFGENAVNRPSFEVGKKSPLMEAALLGRDHVALNRESYESDNSDDIFGGGESSKYLSFCKN